MKPNKKDYDLNDHVQCLKYIADVEEYEKEEESKEEKKEHVIEYNDGSRYGIECTGALPMLYSEKGCPSEKHGRYRKTKPNAEYSIKRNQRANRLEALVEDLQGELGVGDSTIFYNKITKKWEYLYVSKGCYFPEVVVIAEETAKKVCELLNKGLYKLEV